MDLVHNTYGTFVDTENYKYHKTLYSFKSIREVFKDTELKKNWTKSWSWKRVEKYNEVHVASCPFYQVFDDTMKINPSK